VAQEQPLPERDVFRSFDNQDLDEEEEKKES